LILSARIDATLLIRLDGCHAKTFSNEQGPELDVNLNLINATKTLHNENLQDLVNIFHFSLLRESEFNFSHRELFWQDLRLSSYWITTDSPGCFNLSC
jgi:hypothetical protein